MLNQAEFVRRMVLNDAARDEGERLPYPHMRDPDQFHYYGGLDLGKMADRSALCIIADQEKNPGVYHLGYLKQWPRRCPYTKVASDIKVLYEKFPAYRNMPLSIDNTGIGTVFSELLDTAGVAYIPITISGGLEEKLHTDDPGSSVPKTQLVSALQVALESEKIIIHGQLGLKTQLHRQFKAFEAKTSDTGRQLFGARTGHDDLILALALALYCVRMGTIQFFV